MNFFLLLLSSFISCALKEIPDGFKNRTFDRFIPHHHIHGNFAGGHFPDELVEGLGDAYIDDVVLHDVLKSSEVVKGKARHFDQDIFVPVAHNVYVPVPIPVYVPIPHDVEKRVPYKHTEVNRIGVPKHYSLDEDVYVDVPYPLDYPVPVEKIIEVDVPYTIAVEKPIRKEIPVEIPVERRIPVTRATPVEINIQHTEYIPNPYDVIVHVPVKHDVDTSHHRKVPVYVPYSYDLFEPVPYDVPVPYTIRHPKIVNKDVPYQYKVPKTYEVNYPVPVAVYHPHSVPYPVTVENPVPVHVPFPIYRPVRINVPVEIPVSIPVSYEVPVKYVVYLPDVQTETVETYLEVPVPYEVDVPIPYEVYYPVSHEQDRYFPKPYVVQVPEEVPDEIPVVVDDIHGFPVEEFVPHTVDERYATYETRYHPVSYEVVKNSFYDVPYDIVVPVPVEHKVYTPEPYLIDVHRDIFVPEPYQIFDSSLPVRDEHEFAIDLNPIAPVYHQSFRDSDIHHGLFSKGGMISDYKGIDDLGGILAEHGSLIHGYHHGYDPNGYRQRQHHGDQRGNTIGYHHPFQDPFGHHNHDPHHHN